MRPERIVHIGLGAFFRAHQAWYTEHARDAKDWGIVAYTGRSPKLAQELSSQDCQYTLITRGESVDRFETISSVVRAVAGTAVDDLISTLSSPAIAVVTLTITEAGYQVDAGANLTESALGRLALALDARRVSTGLPLALVSCDNMPDNGNVLRAALIKLGTSLGTEFLDYLNTLSFVATSIDRITPATTQQEIELVKAKGFQDSHPVVTEEFSDWILEGEFPLGRPDWASAGAKFVSHLEPFENRKLWLLNGAHSLMAIYGQLEGHQSVDAAIGDLKVREAVTNWWDAAGEYLTEPELDLDSYKQKLLARFQNSRMSDQLERIAKDSITKLSVRIAPVALKELEQGRVSAPAAFAIGAYVAFVMAGNNISDARGAELERALEQQDQLRAIVELINSELAHNPEFVAAVRSNAAQLLAQRVEI